MSHLYPPDLPVVVFRSFILLFSCFKYLYFCSYVDRLMLKLSTIESFGFFFWEKCGRGELNRLDLWNDRINEKKITFSCCEWWIIILYWMPKIKPSITYPHHAKPKKKLIKWSISPEFERIKVQRNKKKINNKNGTTANRKS